MHGVSHPLIECVSVVKSGVGDPIMDGARLRHWFPLFYGQRPAESIG